MSIFTIQIFIFIHFINLAVQNAAKERMAKYYPQKSLSNNARSVVKSLPLTLKCRQIVSFAKFAVFVIFAALWIPPSFARCLKTLNVVKSSVSPNSPIYFPFVNSIATFCQILPFSLLRAFWTHLSVAVALSCLRRSKHQTVFIYRHTTETEVPFPKGPILGKIFIQSCRRFL